MVRNIIKITNDLRQCTRTSLALGVGVLFIGTSGLAQQVLATTASISGNVQVTGIGAPDMPGEGTEVTATPAGDTSAVATVTADAGGDYLMEGLAEGSYDIAATLSGFEAPVSESITVPEGSDLPDIDFLLNSSVEGAFDFTSGGTPIEGGQFLAGETIENVNLWLERTDTGGALDFKVSLSIRDADGNELNWPDPNAGILDEATLVALAGHLGTDPGDATFNVAGEAFVQILDDVSITLGENAEQMDSLSFHLIDDRYLPEARIKHSTTFFDVKVERPSAGSVLVTGDGTGLDGKTFVQGSLMDLSIAVEGIHVPFGTELALVFDGQRPSDTSPQAGEGVAEDLLGASDAAAIGGAIGFANSIISDTTLFEDSASIRADGNRGSGSYDFSW